MNDRTMSVCRPHRQQVITDSGSTTDYTPNPGLMPTARERATADKAITATVNRLRRACVDVDGDIVVTRHAHRATPRIGRRRGATTGVLVGHILIAGVLRRFLAGGAAPASGHRLGRSVTVSAMMQG